MTKEEIIKNLEDQLEDREGDIDADDPDCIFLRDAEALREAIKLLSDTHQVKLDRSRWERCDYCNETLKEYSWINSSSIQESSLIYNLPKYCPMCDRPLTEEAWAELERRIST